MKGSQGQVLYARTLRDGQSVSRSEARHAPTHVLQSRGCAPRQHTTRRRRRPRQSRQHRPRAPAGAAPVCLAHALLRSRARRVHLLAVHGALTHEHPHVLQGDVGGEGNRLGLARLHQLAERKHRPPVRPLCRPRRRANQRATAARAPATARQSPRQPAVPHPRALRTVVVHQDHLARLALGVARTRHLDRRPLLNRLLREERPRRRRGQVGPVQEVLRPAHGPRGHELLQHRHLLCLVRKPALGVQRPHNRSLGSAGRTQVVPHTARSQSRHSATRAAVLSGNSCHLRITRPACATALPGAGLHVAFFTGLHCALRTGLHVTFFTGSPFLGLHVALCTGLHCAFLTGSLCAGLHCAFRTGLHCALRIDLHCAFVTGALLTGLHVALLTLLVARRQKHVNVALAAVLHRQRQHRLASGQHVRRPLGVLALRRLVPLLNGSSPGA
eukprot:Rhum_TRINITY_DN2685_c0_g1::Rhum_TRINITY_DN2685_c0_g1_i1::g.7713::m.7713